MSSWKLKLCYFVVPKVIFLIFFAVKDVGIKKLHEHLKIEIMLFCHT
jgi:hypothetical protein